MRHITISKSITSRDFQSVEKYLQDIKKSELLSPEEEATLTAKIKDGDQKALERLIKANLRFVVSVAKQYQNQGLTLPDLINEGNIGLIKAAQRFDETKGFKFISYAVWWIRQSIHNAIAEQGRIVRLPINKFGLNSRIGKALQTLEQELEREPTAEEIADFLQITQEDVTTSLMMVPRHYSVDDPLSAEEDHTLLDVLVNANAAEADEKLVRDESLQKEIDLSLQILTDKQKSVLSFYYGIGVDHALTLDDIGKLYSLSRERVRQIKDKAIEKLRTTPRCKELKVYLG
jgi:RNA polymerase primary sigma factor